MLATVAVLLTVCGWAAIGYLFSGSNDPAINQWRQSYGSCPWKAQQTDLTPENALRPLVFEDSLFGPPDLGEFPQSPYFDAWWELAAPFRQLFSPQLTYVSLAFVLLCLLWVVLVWAFFGGAIVRIASLELTRHEQIGWKPAFKHAREKFLAYFSAPLLPLLGVLLFTLPIVVLGLLMRLDVGLLVAGIVWPLVLIGGLLMGIMLLGLFFGWPLMWGAIGTEASDSFDALSRSYSYVISGPITTCFMPPWRVSSAYWAGCWCITSPALSCISSFGPPVGEAATSRLHTALAEPATLGTLGAWGAQLIMFWNGVVLLLPGVRLQLLLGGFDDHLPVAPLPRRRHGNGRGVPRRDTLPTLTTPRVRTDCRHYRPMRRACLSFRRTKHRPANRRHLSIDPGGSSVPRRAPRSVPVARRVAH